jgi:hypothetical protein
MASWPHAARPFGRPRSFRGEHQYPGGVDQVAEASVAKCLDLRSPYSARRSGWEGVVSIPDRRPDVGLDRRGHPLLLRRRPALPARAGGTSSPGPPGRPCPVRRRISIRWPGAGALTVGQLAMTAMGNCASTLSMPPAARQPLGSQPVQFSPEATKRTERGQPAWSTPASWPSLQRPIAFHSASEESPPQRNPGSATRVSQIDTTSRVSVHTSA